MPVRVALNLAYSLLMDGRDEKERRDIDNELYGWGAMNERGNRVLSGGEG